MLAPAALSIALYVAFNVSGRVLAPWLKGETTNDMLTDALGSPAMLKWPAAGLASAIPWAPWPGNTLPNTKFRSAATVIGRNTLAVTFMVALFWACAVATPAATSARARTATFVAVCIWVLLLWRQSVVLRYRHTTQGQDICPPVQILDN